MYIHVPHVPRSKYTFAISIFLPARAQTLRGFMTTRTTKILTVRIGETFPTVATAPSRHVRRLVAPHIVLATLFTRKVLFEYRAFVQPPQINVVADITGPVVPVLAHITDAHPTMAERPTSRQRTRRRAILPRLRNSNLHRWPCDRPCAEIAMLCHRGFVLVFMLGRL